MATLNRSDGKRHKMPHKKAESKALERQSATPAPVSIDARRFHLLDREAEPALQLVCWLAYFVRLPSKGGLEW